MTTITIDDKLDRTKFNSIRELYSYLQELIQPMEVFLVDDEDLPNGMPERIAKASEDTSDIVDFRG